MMNNLTKVILLPEKIKHFCFGLASLDAKIRFLETILHLVYRLGFANELRYQLRKKKKWILP